ncbi:MAG: thermonuclease family protein [Bacilli bacterium]|nr:thermonuclease family protein [Bacilli bacterium]
MEAIKTMKKRYSLIALLAMATALASCGGTPAASSSAADTSAEASVSSVELIDYAGETHLDASFGDYASKDFLVNGYGQVDLVRKIDGDTAHFYPHGTKSNLIKSRYNCIDTPESTGMLEPWGHGASDRNGELLANAKTIVLTTDSADQKGVVAPVLDSTGGRYLTYIWVSEKENATVNDLELVNLILVQEGWSKQKGASGKDFANAFLNANNQAMEQKLRIWSPDPDPDFNYAGASECDLKMICTGVNVEGQPFDWAGSKACFDATVVATGPDTGACYLNEDIDGVRYGIYVFTQYRVLDPLTVVGNRVNITGTVARFGAVEDEDSGETTDEGVLQLVDAQYSPWGEEGEIKLLETGVKMDPLTGNLADLKKPENVNVIVSVDDLVCTGGKAVQDTATKSAYAFTLYCKDKNGEEINIRIDDGTAVYPGDEPGGDNSQTRIMSVDYFKSATSISITGAMVTYYGKYQIKLCSRQGITVTGGTVSA